MLRLVKARAEFEDDNDNRTITISCRYNLVAILVAIAQLLFAAATLFRARGDQISKYGYAAFGLTVIQYALMSLINLLGNLVCPQYPTLYLVESGRSDQARTDPETIIDGSVGRVLREHHDRSLITSIFGKPSSPKRLVLSWFPTLVTLAIIAALSAFRKGSSTRSQRVWIMTWLAIDSFFGATFGSAVKFVKVHSKFAREHGYLGHVALTLHILFQICAIVPAVGGFVVVGKMLVEYGSCTAIE